MSEERKSYAIQFEISNEKKRCFVITPIGPDGSEIRRATNGLLQSVLRPVLVEFGYEVKAAHEMEEGGSITNQVVKAILEDDLVVANLTGLNPNVMYELAIRHGVNKPVIAIVEKGTSLPFDINQERTIFFVNDFEGGEELRSALRKAVRRITEGSSKETDNPITRVVKDTLIKKDLDIKHGSVNDYMLEKLDLILSKVERNNIPASSRLEDHSIFSASYTITSKDKKLPTLEQAIEIVSSIFGSIPAGSMTFDRYNDSCELFLKYEIDLYPTSAIEVYARLYDLGYDVTMSLGLV
ncbi:hypothetical protein DYU11_18390 [Fibrisoma montanum]|uniref:Nucleoside 2-deoxyribosyltransferase n=1 Tax=Fibrisoma montanum TaxID=2305895 RepID=A0A418M6F7_9BACT|nr:hypothetical protein [Fibrisoma montanum]RIV21376.1 hypothetical protein DYU11_18390 [Fibrisoma montanum]